MIVTRYVLCNFTHYITGISAAGGALISRFAGDARSWGHRQSAANYKQRYKLKGWKILKITYDVPDRRDYAQPTIPAGAHRLGYIYHDLLRPFLVTGRMEQGASTGN